MSRFGFVLIFILVLIVHLVAFSTKIDRDNSLSTKPNKVYNIILKTRVLQQEVQKSKEPQKSKSPIKSEPKTKLKPKKKFLVPPVMIDEPKIEPKPKPKLKKHKRVKKRKIHKQKRVIPKKSTNQIKKQKVVTKTRVSTNNIDQAIKESYLRYIREQIRENLYYPKVAKRLKIEGVVKVGFIIKKSGVVSNILVLNHPHRSLVLGAKRTLNSLSLKPIPSNIGESSLKLEIPIEFKLRKR